MHKKSADANKKKTGIKRKMVCLAILAGMLLLAGCGRTKAKANADSSLSEKEVIRRVKAQVMKDCGEEVSVEIVSKENLKEALFYLDGPCFERKIKGVYWHDLKIKDGEVETTGRYYEGYSHPYGDHPGNLIYSLKLKETLEDVRYKFERAAERKITDFYIVQDTDNPYGVDVFLCSENASDVEEALTAFQFYTEMVKKEVNVTFSVYIFKDKALYDSMGVENYPARTEEVGEQSDGREILELLSKKSVTPLAYARGFQREFFNTDGLEGAERTDDSAYRSSYDRLVFWMSVEPDSYAGGRQPELFLFKIEE